MNKEAEAEGWIQKGNTFIQQRRYDKAERMFFRAIQSNPKNGQIYQRLGYIYYIAKDWDKALLNYRKAALFNQDLTIIYISLGTILTYQTRYSEAIEYHAQAADADPNNSQIYYSWGKTYSYMRQYGEAIDKFMKAIELNPNFSQAHHCFGLMLMHQKQYAQATLCFQKAIELDPNLTQAYADLAHTLRMQKRFSDAKVFERQNKDIIIKVWQDSVNLDLSQCNFNKAERTCKQIVQLDPASGEGYRSLGDLYSYQKKWGRAVTNYRKAVDLLPQLLKPYIGLANALCKQRKQSEALLYYARGATHSPRSVRLYYEWGWACYYIGAHDEAIEKFLQAIEINPENEKCFEALAIAFARRGSVATAKLWLNKAKELDPSCSRTYRELDRLASLGHKSLKRPGDPSCPASNRGLVQSKYNSLKKDKDRMIILFFLSFICIIVNLLLLLGFLKV